MRQRAQEGGVGGLFRMPFKTAVYDAGFRYDLMCRNLQPVIRLEGGIIFFSEIEGVPCLVTDESYWAEFMGPDELICIRWFRTAAARSRWAGSNLSAPLRAGAADARRLFESHKSHSRPRSH